MARPSTSAPGGPGPVAGAPLSEAVRPSTNPTPRDPVAAAFAKPRTPPTSEADVPTAPPISDNPGPDAQGSAPAPALAGPEPELPTAHAAVERHSGCTTAQLRRFIKSRAYVPMHEIRRRFLIATEDDDVAGIELGSGRIFVGLPEREGQMLGELLRGGEIGYELQLDPVAPVVVGVYPMRPVTRG
ncbi:MAG: hypothetical protein ACXWW6_07010 [Candidatus Limnocylindrales bacterium]